MVLKLIRLDNRKIIYDRCVNEINFKSSRLRQQVEDSK